MCPVRSTRTGASGRTTRWRLSPWSIARAVPLASTAVTAAGATRVTGPNAASAGNSTSAIALSPARLRLPELIAAHANVRSSIVSPSIDASNALSAAESGFCKAEATITRAF